MQKFYFSFFLLLPLLFSPFSGETEGAKLGYAVLWPLLFLIGSFCCGKEEKIRYNFFSWTLVGILGLGVASSLSSANPMEAFLGDQYRHFGFVVFLALFSLPLLLPSLFEKKREKTFIQILVYSGFISAIVAAALSSLDIGALFEDRWSGLMGNPNNLGQFLAVTSFFALYTLFEKKNLLSFLLFATQFLVLLETGNRASWLGFLLAAFLLIFCSNKTTKYKKNLSLALGVIGLFFFLAQWQRWIATESLMTRFTLYKDSIFGVFQEPFFGFGVGQYGSVFTSPEFNTSVVDRAHQFFLDWALGLGLPSMLLIAGLCVFSFWVFYKSRSILGLGFLVLFLSLQSGFMDVTGLCLLATFLGFAHTQSLKIRRPI